MIRPYEQRTDRSDDLDRLLHARSTGQPLDDRLGAALRSLRRKLTRPVPPSVAAHHLTSITQAARQAAGHETAAASPPRAIRTALRRLTAAAAFKFAAAATAAAAATGGLAATGNLPQPVQEVVAGIADRAGIHLPGTDPRTGRAARGPLPAASRSASASSAGQGSAGQPYASAGQPLKGGVTGRHRSERRGAGAAQPGGRAGVGPDSSPVEPGCESADQPTDQASFPPTSAPVDDSRRSSPRRSRNDPDRPGRSQKLSGQPLSETTPPTAVTVGAPDDRERQATAACESQQPAPATTADSGPGSEPEPSPTPQPSPSPTDGSSSPPRGTADSDAPSSEPTDDPDGGADPSESPDPDGSATTTPASSEGTNTSGDGTGSGGTSSSLLP